MTVCAGRWKGMMFFSLPLVGLATTLMRGSAASLRFVMLTAACGQVINRSLKLMIARQRPKPPCPRPPRFFDVYIPLQAGDPDGASFPSGDAMAGAYTCASL